MNDLLHQNETRAMVRFAIPMILGNLFQQLYNVADSIIVGRFLGPEALAAVGSAFAIMVFLTSVILGLCMGSGAVFSFFYGAGDAHALKLSFFASFCFIGIVSVAINVLALVYIDPILHLMQIPADVLPDTRAYLQIIFCGIMFTSVYNYFAALMRSLGNSRIPLVFLIVAALVNIVCDIWFVVPLQMGIAGAAYATILAQFLSALGILVYCVFKVPQIRLSGRHMRFDKKILGMIANQSILTSLQQSIMNFGILMVQGLVNSFGVPVMAAFAAAAKIDSFAYMPAQDFGNAFSTFIAQNRGAAQKERIARGIRSALKIVALYCALISALVLAFSGPLMHLFIDPAQGQIVSLGIQYLKVVAPFYFLIGCLFLFYGLFRGMGRPGVSIVLTVASLGTRVALAYALSSIPSLNVLGIWWAVPLGWAIADGIGLFKTFAWMRRGGGL